MILVGALLAASTGVVGATVVTMGLLSLPAMLRAGYDPKLASGIICASGTLGQIIPPSTILIFMGDMLAGMNAQAQMAKGNFAPTVVSVGNLFAGAFIPGLMLALAYLLFVIWVAFRRPAAAPALVTTAVERASLLRDVLVSMLPTLALIVAVLGSILAGIATPTESASVGAVGAMLLAAARRRFSWANLRGVMESTAVTTSMVFVILIGASVFSLVFRMLGGDKLVADFMTALPGGRIGAIVFVMALMFVLGFILDTFEIIFVIIPVTAPVLLMMDFDPVWLGVDRRGEPADELPDPAVRVLALLSAQRRARLGLDRADLPGRGAVRAAADRGDRAVDRLPRTGDLAAGPPLQLRSGSAGPTERSRAASVGSGARLS